MSQLAVRVQELGKEYSIGIRAEKGCARRSTRLFATHSSRWRPHPRAPAAPAPPQDDGEDLGAAATSRSTWPRARSSGSIGRNGAGKSTLLKILSRITEPTHGHGGDPRPRRRRCSRSGTGFHPELTGRENIFLNGAILGMRRARDRAQVRRDRRVRRGREVHRHAGEALLERHVRAARVRGRGAPRAGDPARRRGARRRRRRVPEEVPRQDGRRRAGGADGALRQPQHGRRSRRSARGRSSFARARLRIDVRRRPTSCASTWGTSTRRRRQAFDDNPDRRGDGSVRLTGARGSSTIRARHVKRLIAGSPVTLEFAYENRVGADRVEINLGIINHLGVAVAHFSTKVAGFPVVGLGPSRHLDLRHPEASSAARRLQSRRSPSTIAATTSTRSRTRSPSASTARSSFPPGACRRSTTAPRSSSTNGGTRCRPRTSPRPGRTA